MSEFKLLCDMPDHHVESRPEIRDKWKRGWTPEEKESAKERLRRIWESDKSRFYLTRKGGAS